MSDKRTLWPYFRSLTDVGNMNSHLEKICMKMKKYCRCMNCFNVMIKLCARCINVNVETFAMGLYLFLEQKHYLKEHMCV